MVTEADPFEIFYSGSTLPLTISIGVAIGNPDRSSLDYVLATTDRTLNEIKAARSIRVGSADGVKAADESAPQSGAIGA